MLDVWVIPTEIALSSMAMNDPTNSFYRINKAILIILSDELNYRILKRYLAIIELRH